MDITVCWFKMVFLIPFYSCIIPSIERMYHSLFNSSSTNEHLGGFPNFVFTNNVLLKNIVHCVNRDSSSK